MSSWEVKESSRDPLEHRVLQVHPAFLPRRKAMRGDRTADRDKQGVKYSLILGLFQEPLITSQGEQDFDFIKISTTSHVETNPRKTKENMFQNMFFWVTQNPSSNLNFKSINLLEQKNECRKFDFFLSKNTCLEYFDRMKQMSF